MGIWFTDGQGLWDGGFATEMSDGWYTFTWDEDPAALDRWEVELWQQDLDNGDWILVNPQVNPAIGLDLDVITLEWELMIDPLR